jgi:hypothetical protein
MLGETHDPESGEQVARETLVPPANLCASHFTPPKYISPGSDFRPELTLLQEFPNSLSDKGLRRESFSHPPMRRRKTRTKAVAANSAQQRT